MPHGGAARGVSTSADGAVLIVTIERPDAGNALDLDVAEGLRRALDLAGQSGCGAVLVRSRGRLFCAGGDLAGMDAAASPSEYVDRLAGAMHEVVRAMIAAPFAVVAAVQGAAAGAGFSLALNADRVVAGERASFLSAYADVALSPDCGMSYLLPEVVGLGRARSVILAGRRVSAHEAREWGIVDTVVPQEELDREALAAAHALAAMPAASRAQCKRLMSARWAGEYAAHLDDERVTIAKLAGTDEARRRRAALLGRDVVKAES